MEIHEFFITIILIGLFVVGGAMIVIGLTYTGVPIFMSIFGVIIQTLPAYLSQYLKMFPMIGIILIGAGFFIIALIKWG